MKKIGLCIFPETLEEADNWTPVLIYKPIHSKVLLVAKTRIEGTWSCYVTPVPGHNHDEEICLWENHGVKLHRLMAQAAFPQFNDIPYDP
jgi:hypothetical protein